MQLPKREITVDTETTGLDPSFGHRVVEIGCVELINLIPTGRTYQQYLNPERDMPADAFAVHGLSAEFLVPQPRFADVVDAFLEFLGDAQLVIHNAAFDLKFLSSELARLDRRPLSAGRAVDTVALARRKFPGARASLDALCQRFNIDLSERTLHGALLDAHLLADVYLGLRGGRQPVLDLGAITEPGIIAAQPTERTWPRRYYEPCAAELAAHVRLLAAIDAPIWQS